MQTQQAVKRHIDILRKNGFVKIDEIGKTAPGSHIYMLHYCPHWKEKNSVWLYPRMMTMNHEIWENHQKRGEIEAGFVVSYLTQLAENMDELLDASVLVGRFYQKIALEVSNTLSDEQLFFYNRVYELVNGLELNRYLADIINKGNRFSVNHGIAMKMQFELESKMNHLNKYQNGRITEGVESLIKDLAHALREIKVLFLKEEDQIYEYLADSIERVLKYVPTEERTS